MVWIKDSMPCTLRDVEIARRRVIVVVNDGGDGADSVKQ